MPVLKDDVDKPIAICLMGPTASGKTALAATLYEQLNVELISVDSAQVYREMNIGTAKPTAEELLQLPHRLIDIRDPANAYSAAQFRDDALLAMQEINTVGKTPLLVGGTMLYFRALEYGLAPLPDADAGIRQQLDAEAAEIGWPAMHARLRQVDPVTAERLQPTDPQRIQRALEVYELTGEPLSVLQQRQEEVELPFQLVKLALMPSDRAALHARIEQRFQVMMQQGFLEEVQKLFQRNDLHSDFPSIRSVGYRQLWQYLKGEWDLPLAVEKGTTATRQLAKRQLTWIRNDDSWQKIDTNIKNLHDEALKVIKNHPI